jgi:uncharacterized protein YciI
MKNLLSFILCLLFAGSIHAQKTNPNYDAELAKSLGADEYGMKYYVFVILKTGKNAPDDNELRQKSFAGHMKNIKSLVEEEKLIVAGPFDANELSYRGLFILNVKTIDEAKQLLKTDPAIKEGFLDTELFKWYGSAALSEYLETSDKIWKVGF